MQRTVLSTKDETIYSISIDESMGQKIQRILTKHINLSVSLNRCPKTYWIAELLILPTPKNGRMAGIRKRKWSFLGQKCTLLVVIII